MAMNVSENTISSFNQKYLSAHPEYILVLLVNLKIMDFGFIDTKRHTVRIGRVLETYYSVRYHILQG